jgi:Family of unknown function (DUF6152)
MKRNMMMWAVLVASLFVGSTAFAHHGTGLYYGTGTITLKGTVTEFAFVNPHAQIYFDVKDDKGVVQHWAAECVSPGKFARVGFSRDTLKPGDQITITLHPGKSGETVGSFVKLVMADGKELPIRTGGGGE